MASAGGTGRDLAGRVRFVLYIVFVLSGAAGLIYESIWSRYLGLFVGHSAYAQIIVLTIFLGGMSVGAMLAGRRSERLRDPLLWYAAVEIAAGAIGLVFHPLYLRVTDFAYAVFPPLADSLALTVVQWSVAGALILPQSVLLGATFPLMSAGVLRHVPRHPGRILSLLYFTNSIGAAAGVLAEGFWLISAVGLPGTVLTAALFNFVAGLTVYLAARSVTAPAHVEVPAYDSVQPMDSEPSVRRVSRVLLAVCFGTAVASFVYEITWIRMLSLVLGSATHAFELMLSAFILGLALGAFWIRRRADRFASPLRALGTVQWVMGCAALATLPVYVASFTWTAELLQAFSKTAQGYAGFNLARYGICLAVMLPATFCAGMTLPLITKILVVRGWGERAIGWVYSVNTLGSILGVILAGLVLLPVLGLQPLLIVGASVDMLLAVVIFAALGRAGTRLAVAATAATALVVVLAASGTRLDQAMLTSGVYRHGLLPAPGSLRLFFYRDGRTATVAAAHDEARGDTFVASNGKPDASLGPDWFAQRTGTEPLRVLSGDDSTQALLALMTLAHVPHARTAAAIGHGSGMSSHFLLASPELVRLMTIEIEPAMVEASRVFYPLNRRAFDDPRSVLVIDDAKSFFAASSRRYDLILSEPSNPWVSGVASLFTNEFYGGVTTRLAAQGIFGQWLHLYESNDTLVLMVLAAIHQHFQSYAVFQVALGDILIVASPAPSLPTPDWSVFSLPEVRADLGRFVPLAADDLDAMRLIDRAALAPLLDRWGDRNSDFFPALDLGAERARYLLGAAIGFNGLSGDRVDVLAPFVGPRAFTQRSTPAIGGHARLEARALAAKLRGARRSGTLPALADDARAAAAAHRLWRWQAAVDANSTPGDWRLWMADTIEVEADLHGGAAGAADEEFYGAVHRYFERQNPPRPAQEAVAFLEGWARWDFARVADAADALLADARNGHAWIPVKQLRDAAVIAKLRTGDAPGARAYFDALSDKVPRDLHDVRNRLLEAYLAHPEALPQR